MALVFITSIVLTAVSLGLSMRQSSAFQELRNDAIHKADLIAKNGSVERYAKLLEKAAVNLLNTDELVVYLKDTGEKSAKMVIEGMYLSFQGEGIVRFILYDQDRSLLLEQAGGRPGRKKRLPPVLDGIYAKAAEDFNFYYYFRGAEGGGPIPVEYCLVTVITDDDDNVIGFGELSLDAGRWITEVAGLTGNTATLFDPENRAYTLSTDSSVIKEIGKTDIVGTAEEQFTLVNLGEKWLLTDKLPLEDPGENIVSYLLLSQDATVAVMRERRRVIYMISISCGIILVALAAALLVVSRGIISPIRRVIDFARNMAEGHFVDSLEVRSKDEVGMMSSALNEMAERIRRRAAEAEAVSAGNLTVPISVSSEGDVLGMSLRKIVYNFGEIISQVREDAEMLQKRSSMVSSYAEEIQGSSEVIKQRSSSISESSDSIAEDVEKLASATEQMSASVREISENTSRSKAISSEANELSRSAGDTIGRLDRSADKIEKASGEISDFADQTNLLALNATIEAARAGEAGKGFAVVAAEVKELAIRSITTAKSISNDVDEIQIHTKDVVRQTEKVSTSISEIDEAALIVSSALTEQSAVAEDLAQTISSTYERVKSFAVNVSDIDDSIRQNNEVILSLTDSAQDMSELANRLQKLVSQFELDQTSELIEKN